MLRNVSPFVLKVSKFVSNLFNPLFSLLVYFLYFTLKFDTFSEGLKKSEEEDLQTKLALTKGSQITPDLLDRSKIAIKKEMAGKGYYNAEVFMYEKADPAQVGSVILDVNVDKKEKIKVREIYVTGNQALSLNSRNRRS